nr:ImmA/IrrE family metallo-endopeptidase [uncultured Oscillibacter sp.]
MGSELFSAISTARKVLEDYKLNRIPIDVEGLCDSLGIKIHYVDFSSIEGKVKKEISGAIQKNGDTYTILVNENESDVRARFTIAHELGHYFLHVKNDSRQIVTSFRRDQSPRETAANKFAAELLMPKKLIQEEYAKMVIPISDTLAKKFEVSKPAMRIRLESLDLMYV